MTRVDLDAEMAGDAGGDGVHWTLAAPNDLNVNLVRLEPGHAIDEHVNDAVDVVVIGTGGHGVVTVDGVDHSLGPHVVVDIPKGSARRIRAGDEGLWHLTVHRRKGGVVIEPGPPGRAPSARSRRA